MDLSRSFQIKGDNAADKVTITVTAHSTCVDNIDPASISLEIRSYGTPPPGPSLSSVMYNDAGNALTIKFDSGTDRYDQTSFFPCNELFNFTGVMGSYCLWVTDMKLIAPLGTIALRDLNIADDFTVRASKMYSKCQYPY